MTLPRTKVFQHAPLWKPTKSMLLAKTIHLSTTEKPIYLPIIKSNIVKGNTI